MKNSYNAMLNGPDIQLSREAYHTLLSEIAGTDQVITDPQELCSYATALNGSQVQPVAVVLPTTEAQVVALVMQANRYRFSLYPLSRGKNFGYGTAQGTAAGQVIVDLSQMNEVREVNEELGYVTLQPGVSQQQLYEYLRHLDSRLQMDVTGGGRTASIVGNVLERGFGHTDYGSRVDNILNLRVVLPTGEVISTGYGDFPEAQAAHTYRHGIGPSVDGLFTQSNLGIVTQMTLALQPAPDHFCMFFFKAPKDRALETIVENIRELQLSGAVSSTVHLANRQRLLRPGIANKGGAWNVSGVISGTPELVRARRKEIVRQFRKNKARGKLAFMTDRKMKWLRWFHQNIKPIPLLESIQEVMNVKKGIPTDSAIQALVNNKEANSENLLQQTGDHYFKWISAVCPAKTEAVREMVSILQRIFEKEGYLCRITLTFINPRSLILISEITYTKAEIKKANVTYQACILALKKAGYYAYRGGSGSYTELLPDDIPLFTFAQRLKQVFDPNGILAPGKYNLSPNPLPK